MKKNNLEREFNIEAIASVVEVCCLTNTEEILDFCSFITGKKITSVQDIADISDEIMFLLKEQYPEFKRHIFLANGDFLSNICINAVIKAYQEKYGEKIKIRTNNIKENAKKITLKLIES